MNTIILPPVGSDVEVFDRALLYCIFVEVPDQLGPYQILNLLGTGGMSQVYRAQKEDESPIALKVLSMGLVQRIPQFLGRFQREISAMMALLHPNIVTIYDAGEADGFYYIAMELMEGESLKERLVKGALPPGALDRLIAETASAVGYCHERGVLHRDLKPTNLFILRDGRTKVLDFGLAKSQTDQPLTTVGKRIGTPRYMAPEVIRGAAPDVRSDLYQLGLCYYEAACGRAAFPEADMMTVLQKVLTQNPPALQGLAPAVPEAFVTIIENCLSKDPTHRYDSCTVILEDLELARQGGVVKTRRP